MICHAPQGMLRFAFCALFFAGLVSSGAQQLPPGVSAGAHLASLPLPRSGYQVYLMGEMHGAKENAYLFGRGLPSVSPGDPAGTQLPGPVIRSHGRGVPVI